MENEEYLKDKNKLIEEYEKDESTPLYDLEYSHNKKYYDVNKLINDISLKIVGQEEAITTLVTNIYFNQLLIDKLSEEYFIDTSILDSSKVSILLEGSTGTGKTAIVKEIASSLNIPIVMSSANSFSETGYVGPSITDLLRKLYLVSGKELNKAQRGIIFLDEVDKIANKSGINGKDMKKGVQEELLGFISGADYEVSLDPNGYNSKTIHFDTSMITFILAGAWTDLRERKIEEVKKKYKHMGFNTNNTNVDYSYTITAQDYIDDGLEREFFGRIKVLVHTKTYNKDDLRNILLYSTISPLKNFERTVKMFGYKGILCSDEFIDKLVSDAYDMNTGARGLQTIMSGVQNRMLKGFILKEYDLNEKIVLNENIINEYNKSLIRKF